MSEVLPDWLSQRAAAAPDAMALLAAGTHWTFRDLDQQADHVAHCLASVGVEPGDRVATLLGNGPLFVLLVHAAPRLGVVVVPLNLRLSADELSWQLQDAAGRFLVYDDARSETAAILHRECPAVQLIAEERLSPARVSDATPTALAPESSVRLRRHVDLAAVHTVIYTSGTTGRPKGAMLTYGNHWWNAIGSVLNLGLQDGDRWLAVLPLFHVGGLSILFRGVIYGITAVVHESFDAAQVNRAIDEQRVTIVSVVGVMLRRMLDERGTRPYPPWLRCVLLGGGPAPRPLLEECARRNVPVVQTYGMTETASQIVTLAPKEALRKLGSAGRPLLPAEVKIDRQDRTASADQVGEIVVRGPSVTAGYINRPDETSRALRDGWLHTGDLGYLDQEGYLYVVDRRDDLIISGGENVYPAEIEAVLLAHPAIEEAGVIGVPDEQWGHVPVAVVKRRPNEMVSAEEIISFCAERLARYKVPARVRFVDSLPRNAAGKLRRSVLRDREAAELEEAQ